MDDIDRTSEMMDINIRYLCQEISHKASKYTNSDIPVERFCEDCGCRIPQGRLKAVPTATRCVICQTEYEKG